jgi:hypothetical protein
MANYQLLTCSIALAGDLQQIVVRGHWKPVTYAELIVLQFLHGEQAVSDVFECGHEEREPRDEKQRLMVIYGAPLINNLFPGHMSQLPEKHDRYKPRLVGTLVNPGPPVPAEPPLEIDPEIAASVRQPAPQRATK